MARRLAPRTAGDLVELRGPRDSTLIATAPDGLEVRVPAPNGRVVLWVPQPGEWTYMWEPDGPSGTLSVIAPADEVEPERPPIGYRGPGSGIR